MESAGIGMVGGIVFAVIYLLVMAAGIVGWVLLLIAVWRGMKAHESIATSLREIAGSSTTPRSSG